MKSQCCNVKRERVKKVLEERAPIEPRLFFRSLSIRRTNMSRERERKRERASLKSSVRGGLLYISWTVSFHPRRCTDREEGYKPERAADVVRTTHDSIVGPFYYTYVSLVSAENCVFFFLKLPGALRFAIGVITPRPCVYESSATLAILSLPRQNGFRFLSEASSRGFVSASFSAVGGVWINGHVRWSNGHSGS